MPRFAKPLTDLTLAGFLFCIAGAAAAAAPRVETTIKPVHSLVAGVMTGMGTPNLLIQGTGSPHAYALRPSEARRLQEADVIFWVGPTLETFLTRPLTALARRARVVSLIDSPGLTRLETRNAGIWKEETDHDHGHGHDEKPGASDPHVWLDPANAAAMTKAIATALAAADPEIGRASCRERV